MTGVRLASVDVNCWIGPYPYRDIPHPDPDVLVRVLDREGIEGGWVGSLPGVFHRDPTPSNRSLVKSLAAHRDRLHPAPLIRPDWPGWERELRRAIDAGAPAVKACPPQWGYAPGSAALNELALACGEAGLVLLLTVRFEDLRQRHWLDSAGDLAAAAIRAVARLPHSRCRLVVLGAGRELIEETHWGLTEEEQHRVWYDFSWVWGPPEDHFAHLLRTMGPGRFVVGTGWPLRLTQQSRSLLELLPETIQETLLRSPLAEGELISRDAKSGTRGG